MVKEYIRIQKSQIIKGRQESQERKQRQMIESLANDPAKSRLFEAACEKGASNWLTCMPSIENREFQSKKTGVPRWSEAKIWMAAQQPPFKLSMWQ